MKDEKYCECQYDIMNITYKERDAGNRLDMNIDIWQNLNIDIWCKIQKQRILC